jgi:CheY-like chemotaxis protein
MAGGLADHCLYARTLKESEMSSVVIVDDQGVNRKVLASLAATLEPDVEVKAFGDPFQALSYIREHTPDLLITDYQMPTMNGAELIRRFRDVPDCRDVPAVVVTAYEDVAFRATALDAGANGFILSPLNHIEFRLQSRRLLAQRHSGAADISAAPGLTQAVDQFGMFNSLLENVSASLVLKIGELKRIDAELRTLLEVTATPAVFVDEAFRVRHFAPRILDIYAMTARDIGRPLDSVACELRHDGLAVDFADAMRTGNSFERYLETGVDAARYRVRIVPIRYADGSAVGALITFTAIDTAPERRPGGRAIH